MKITRRKIIIFILLLAFAGYKLTTSYGPYYGKVVELETGKPLEGAAVSIAFFTDAISVGGTVSYYADAVETLTDDKGEFHLPRHWTFAFRPFHFWNAHGDVQIFKPGYGCYPKHRKVEPMFIPNGTLPERTYVTIKLPKLKTKEEKLENLYCEPTSVPKYKYQLLYNLIQDERENLGLKTLRIILE